MKTIDSFTTADGMVYMLHQQDNGDYVITNSDGDMQPLTGMAQAEAMTVWNDCYLTWHPSAREVNGS